MTTGSYWRDICQPIIRDVIHRVGTEDAKALRKALIEAYPFCRKKGHPYRIWRDEIKKQLEGRQHSRPPRADPVTPGQLSLLSQEARP